MNPMPRSVRLSVVALSVAAAAGAFLAALTLWALATIPRQAQAFATALTPADRAVFEADDRDPTAVGSQLLDTLPTLAGYGLAIAIFGLVTLGVRRGRGWGRVATWVGTLVIGVVGGVLIIVDHDFRLYGLSPDEFSAGAVAAYDALLPVGYAGARYALEIAVLAFVIAASVLLSRSSSQEFFQRRFAVTAEDPRLWTIKRPG